MYGILEALHIAATSLDIPTVLRSLISPATTDCDIVNKFLSVIGNFKEGGASVHFTWVPSHVGIPFNEKANNLAQLTFQDDGGPSLC